jgi:hypothetical protein
MPDLITRAQPPLEFIPPAYDPMVRRVFNWLLPLVIRSRTTIRQIDAQNVETLVNLYQQFQMGKSRFLLAFRHPSADDPFCLAHLLWREMPAVAKQQGITFQHPHLHFIYDRGIPIWAGNWTTWLYTRLGGTPIHRGKIDLVGLRSARDLFANGKFPIMAAPEGATNGHTEVISPLEPGIAQLGFWCADDLRKADRQEQVFILPVGIQYHYITPPWDAIATILSQLEADVGLPPVPHSLDETALYRRLYRLGEHLLRVMESYYRRFFHKEIPLVSDALPTSNEPISNEPISNEEFAARLSTLLNAALQVAEDYFALQPKGSVIDRCRRLEQAAWDCIYRDDLKLETISPLERGLADRVAEEADLRVWHMRLVESFVAVTGKYVQEKPSVERFAETTLLAWDMICRIKGGNPFQRPKLGAQKAVLIVGEPISVSDRWQTYTGGRKNAKQAIETLTKDLQVALEEMI